jgi:hypothetical protein
MQAVNPTLTIKTWRDRKACIDDIEYRKFLTSRQRSRLGHRFQQSTRRRKEVTKRLEYQAQTSESKRQAGNCRAKGLAGKTTHLGHCQPHKLPSHIASPTALSLPCYSTNTVTQCKHKHFRKEELLTYCAEGGSVFGSNFLISKLVCFV